MPYEATIITNNLDCLFKGLFVIIPVITQIIIIKGFTLSQKLFKLILAYGNNCESIKINNWKVTLTHKFKFRTTLKFDIKILDLSGTLVKDDFEYIDEYGWKLLCKAFSKCKIKNSLEFIITDDSLYSKEDILKIMEKYKININIL